MTQQLKLFGEEATDDWTSDDWQTPSEVAQLMARLIRPSERFILEPAAGTGQIIKAIAQLHPTLSLCANDIKLTRCLQGEADTPTALWMTTDFLAPTQEFNNLTGFDLIITNPPFSLCVQFIRRSLSLLNPENPNARLLFLLPLDWNCPLGRAEAWGKLDAHIHHTYRIKGRVAFLDAVGVPQKSRQCSDAVFDIRRGRSPAADSYLEEGPCISS